ncbi:MAG: arsinothricin resistance N-acetyltransferase ArsN1 family A [Ktedonobacterales bacterium]
MSLRLRQAELSDSASIALIYNQGIEDRIATFETHLRAPEDVQTWFDGIHPIMVVEEGPGEIVAFASTSSYRPRSCYAGIAEASVYVRRDARRQGTGRVALMGLLDAAREAGFWKLVSRVFVENTASRALIRSVGFREVGTYLKHGKLDGIWRDVVIVEYLIAENLT